MSNFYIHKQLIPNTNIWVLKLDEEDSIHSFETIEEAHIQKESLIQNDESERIYKVVTKNEDGSFSDT